jgi:hypothetical protein
MRGNMSNPAADAHALGAAGVEAAARHRLKQPSSPPLGEELPIFCERCGYSLHGLPHVRCERCTLLQFHCPECGHRQPINTLRPAAHRIIGRVRAVVLAIIVFLKLMFFGWLLFGWLMVGVEYSYQRRWDGNRTVVVNGQVVQRGGAMTYATMRLQLEVLIALGLFGIAFGAVGRMLLLRWPRGYAVGLVLAVLVGSLLALGAHMNRVLESGQDLPSPFTQQFVLLIVWAGVMVWLAASTVWPVWALLVNVFLPRKTATALLDWQRHHSASPAALARE